MPSSVARASNSLFLLALPSSLPPAPAFQTLNCDIINTRSVYLYASISMWILEHPITISNETGTLVVAPQVPQFFSQLMETTKPLSAFLDVPVLGTHTITSQH